MHKPAILASLSLLKSLVIIRYKIQETLIIVGLQLCIYRNISSIELLSDYYK